jgi:hypothetical protein
LTQFCSLTSTGSGTAGTGSGTAGTGSASTATSVPAAPGSASGSPAAGTDAQSQNKAATTIANILPDPCADSDDEDADGYKVLIVYTH